MPSAEKVQEELAKAESMYDFFGRDGIFARLFANTLEQMLEAELSDKLGYEPYETSGRNLGNNRNGHYRKKVCLRRRCRDQSTEGSEWGF
jgi:putative transposase